MDDDQRPWWTRPPEPGPETRAPRTDDDPPADSAPTDLFAPAHPHQFADPYAPPAPASPAPAAPAPEAASDDDTVPAFTPLAFPSLTTAQPVVRRVAAPQPPPRSDETETLPAVDDSIFATFTGELEQIGPQAPPARASRSPFARSPFARSSAVPFDGDPATQGTRLIDPLGNPVDDQPVRRSPLVRLPDGRVLLLAGAGGLVVLLIVVVALLSGRGPGTAPSAAPATRRAAATSANESVLGRPPTHLKELDGDAASQLLNKAGVNAGGTIVDAWAWDDKNGRNLVVTVISPAAGNKETLRVIHVARLDTNPKTLRIMRDPNLPNCSGTDTGGTAGFTKGALLVRDLNADNIAEVMVGWTSRCGAKGAKSEVKLALISNGQKYIIRGQGVVGSHGDGTTKPDPRSSRWPDSYWAAAEQLYHRLYF